MCSTKPYPFLSKIHTIRTPHQVHIDAKTSRVWKYSSEDKSQNFPPGTTFIPHRHSVKSGLDFVNVLCTQPENYLPILMENNRNHQITLNRGVIGYSSLAISDCDRPKYQVRDCVRMVNSILTENDQYNECFFSLPQSLANLTYKTNYRYWTGRTKQFFKVTPPSLIEFQPTLRWVKDSRKQFAVE